MKFKIMDHIFSRTFRAKQDIQDTVDNSKGTNKNISSKYVCCQKSKTNRLSLTRFLTLFQPLRRFGGKKGRGVKEKGSVFLHLGIHLFGMITFISRGGLLRSSHLLGCKRSPSFQRFSTTNFYLSGSLDSLELSGEEVRKDAKPSEVYQQRVQAGELTADPHQEKVVAQVKLRFHMMIQICCELS